MIKNLFNIHDQLFRIMNQKRKGIAKSPQKSYFKEYNFEITVIVLFGLGIFLLVEDLEIKHYIAVFIRSILFTIGDLMGFLRDGVIFTVKQLETSDIVGIIFILSAMYLIADRWRERMISRYAGFSECPSCGGKLHRIHKNLSQKTLGIFFFLKVKNYKCNSCAFNSIKLEKQ